MTTKSVLHFVKHVISRHPDSAPTVTARCLHPDCGWSVAPTSDVDRADDDCMEHTGREGHGIFARRYEDIAVVTRRE